MKKMKMNYWTMLQYRVLLVSFFLLTTRCSFTSASTRSNNPSHEPAVQIHFPNGHSGNHVIMDNGIVNVTLSVPNGMVTGIQYHGISNLLENNLEGRRGYWDIVWNRIGRKQSQSQQQDMLDGTSFKVIQHNENLVELSFSRTWSFNNPGLPVNTDKRYIMQRGVPGFYSYAIFERPEGWPDVRISQARIAFKLKNKLFSYMAVSDNRQRFMPDNYDRETGRVLDYPEAVYLTNPSNKELKGEVDDKYQFSSNNEKNRVHGWISTDHHVGFWVISPSDEYRSGGPVKQELTSHAGPTSLAMFFSGHYAGDMSLDLENGEPWKKVFGPVFIYLNSASLHAHRYTLWADAKEQMLTQTKSWPYDFPASKDFPRADQRGTVTGRLLVRDRYINQELINASSAYIGLAPPGDHGSWQRDTKGYQFWNRTSNEGYFLLRGVRAGNYSLFAWVPGFIGEYKHDFQITITEGSKINLGNIVFEPPRNGPTVWEIGIPDRTAAEFFIPEPRPTLVTRLHVNKTNSDKFRQYGLWECYTDLHPTEDLVYSVGTSNYQTDWFFAHVLRHVNGTFQPTTWRVNFNLGHVVPGTYTLRIALASANGARLEVWMNRPTPTPTRHLFRMGLTGRDNAIARHGIHGMYWLYEVNIPSVQLIRGDNSMYLRQFGPSGPFIGTMYDYIRLEQPSLSLN